MGSSRTRARTHVPCISRWILNHCATREALLTTFSYLKKSLCAELYMNSLELSSNSLILSLTMYVLDCVSSLRFYFYDYIYRLPTIQLIVVHIHLFLFLHPFLWGKILLLSMEAFLHLLLKVLDVLVLKSLSYSNLLPWRALNMGVITRFRLMPSNSP